MRNIGFETLTVSDTAGGLTVATYSTANYAVLGPLETAQIRYRDDGSNPTSSVGQLLEVGERIVYDGDLSKLKFIRTGATSGVLPSAYYQRG